MEITVGVLGVTGVLTGPWTMDGPPPLLFQSTGGTYFPVTLTPFLLPRLIPVPSIWSLLLFWPSWKTNNGSVTRMVREGQVMHENDYQEV